MCSLNKTILSPTTLGCIGFSFMEPDPRCLESSANPEGRLLAQGLALAIANGYYPKCGDEFQVIAENGQIEKIILGNQELILG